MFTTAVSISREDVIRLKRPGKVYSAHGTTAVGVNNSDFAEKCQYTSQAIHKPTTPLANSDISAFASRTASSNAGSNVKISSGWGKVRRSVGGGTSGKLETEWFFQ